MPLHLSLNDEADELLSRDPFALLTGMLLDQQFPMERAFAGPYLLATRLGLSELDPQVLVSTTEERLLEAAKGPPAIHRYPGSMAKRVQALAEVVLSEYDGDAARIWQDATDGKDALARLEGLPGFGSAKARIFLALVGKQLGQGPPGWQEAARPYSEPGTTMSVADVTSAQTLADVRAWKKHQKQAAKAAE